MMIDIVLRAIGCFVSAIFFALAPCAIGFALGWNMKKEKLYEYLKSLIIRLDDESKLLDGEKEKLLKAVDEIAAKDN